MSDKKKQAKLDVDPQQVKKISEELEGLSEVENTWPEDFAASGGGKPNVPPPAVRMTRPFEL